MIHLDGSSFSGSGTIVRFGVALACLAGQPLHISHVRAGRPKPGLHPQHVMAVQAVASFCDGTLQGAVAGSDDLTFRPGSYMRGGEFDWDIGTAGSTTMLALALLPVAAFAVRRSLFRIAGGLFQDNAPSAFHLQHALLPLLRAMGLQARLSIVRPGYVPSGGGLIEIAVQPVEGALKPLQLVSSEAQPRLWGIALSSHLEQRRVSDRMAEACSQVLASRGLKATMDTRYDTTAIQRGAALALFASTQGSLLGADRAGAPRRQAETIGRSVARTLLADLDSGAAIDQYLADQVLIFAALSDGVSRFRIPKPTAHVLTNRWLVETILGAQVDVSEHFMEVRGVGYRRSGEAITQRQ